VNPKRKKEKKKKISPLYEFMLLTEKPEVSAPNPDLHSQSHTHGSRMSVCMHSTLYIQHELVKKQEKTPPNKLPCLRIFGRGKGKLAPPHLQVSSVLGAKAQKLSSCKESARGLPARSSNQSYSALQPVGGRSRNLKLFLIFFFFFFFSLSFSLYLEDVGCVVSDSGVLAFSCPCRC
jgi:hypothetical protein